MAVNLKSLSPGAAAASSVVVGAGSTADANPLLFTTTGTGSVQLSNSGLSLGTGGAATSTPIFDLSQTWNTTSAMTALKLNVTTTASATASYLLDLQAGGSSKFAVRKDGQVTVNYPVSGAGLTLIGNGDGLITSISGSDRTSYGAYGIRFRAGNNLSWGSTTDGPASADTTLARDSAAVVRLENCLLLKGVAFASLPAAPVAGTLAKVTDSTVTTGQIAGGGSNAVLAYYKASATAGWYVLAAL